MGIYVKKSFIFIFSLCPSCQSRFYHIRWFYLYRSFKHSNWWRHKL